MAWTKDDSKLIYGIGRSDLHFLDISDNGDLQLILNENKISFGEIIKRLSELKIKNSFTLRVPQLINYQIKKIQDTFENLIQKHNYQGLFKPLYPIKVNQQRLEVETVVNSSNYYGLEAGTKSEFLLIRKIFEGQQDRLIMCNGVKDREYVEMIKDALKDGYSVNISIESINEVRLVHSIIPNNDLRLLLRIKPYVNVRGYWGSSASRNSKFGLGIHDLLEVLEFIKQNKFTDQLIGIHAHPGSQIEKIEDMKKYVKFLINVFSEIKFQGFKELRIIDFGGGLPIDYYSEFSSDPVDIYAESIFECILSSDLDIHPHIMIESGRAVTALSSMIVVKPIEKHRVFPQFKSSEDVVLEKIYSEIDHADCIESLVSLHDRWIEYIAIKESIEFNILHSTEYYSGLIKNKLREKVMSMENWIDYPYLKKLLYADIYLYGNFSVFNSAADHVVVDQYFPLMGSKNLHIQPETIIRLVDISCDSDGEISVFKTKKSSNHLYTKDKFPLSTNEPVELKGFPIGKIDDIESTYIIIPLVGAYQDIIESNHNLIGDLADIRIQFDDGWDITVQKAAESIEDIVSDLGFTLEIEADPYVNL